MKEFQNIGKQMPYKESEAYLDQLISSRQKTLSAKHPNAQPPSVACATLQPLQPSPFWSPLV